MKLGSFLVPEMRLDELLASTLSKVYNSSKTEPIQSKVLSELLGYKYGTETTLFKRINSMLAYGILAGRSVYNVTKLGENLLYPENEMKKKQLTTQAIMNVELWKKLYEKHGKNPPKEGLWVSIKGITDVDPATAKEYENRVYIWYMEDMAQLSEEHLEQKPMVTEESKGLSSKEDNIIQMSQSLMTEPIQNNAFGRVALTKGGFVDVIDEDTLEIAKSYLKVLEKKIKEKRTKESSIYDALQKETSRGYVE